MRIPDHARAARRPPHGTAVGRQRPSRRSVRWFPGGNVRPLVIRLLLAHTHSRVLPARLNYLRRLACPIASLAVTTQSLPERQNSPTNFVFQSSASQPATTKHQRRPSPLLPCPCRCASLSPRQRPCSRRGCRCPPGMPPVAPHPPRSSPPPPPPCGRARSGGFLCPRPGFAPALTPA